MHSPVPPGQVRHELAVGGDLEHLECEGGQGGEQQVLDLQRGLITAARTLLGQLLALVEEGLCVCMCAGEIEKSRLV